MAVQLVARVDREVADDDVLDELDEIDRPDVAPGLADGGGEQPSMPGRFLIAARMVRLGESRPGQPHGARHDDGRQLGVARPDLGHRTVMVVHSAELSAKTTRSIWSVPTYTAAASPTANPTWTGKMVSGTCPLSLRRRRRTLYLPGGKVITNGVRGTSTGSP